MTAHRDRDTDLLLILNYYSPYVSGLTNVARDVAEALAKRDWRVRVVATQHEPDLPPSEVVNGVAVERARVLTTIGKGPISPEFIRRAIAFTDRAAVVNVHLPMLEAGVITRFSRAPVVASYHCDVSLPPGWLNDVQRLAIDASSRATLHRSAAVVVTSDDYAEHSRLWPQLNGRTVAIPPPCHDRGAGMARYRDGGGFHVGFLGRIVEEKGVEFLVDAVRGIDDPQLRLLIGGEFTTVAGGSVIERIRGRIAGDQRIKLLGFLADHEIADFYASLDAFALPSVNPFEAFGIVQVEAMMRGVPVLASNLPGVRVPVQETGHGVIAEVRDVAGIRRGLLALCDRTWDRTGGARRARTAFSLDAVVDAYEEVFQSVMRSSG
ncbi:MAG: glycosyltransferase family 4 protein [Geodermatophilaceae bacterium]|nr:glycosyltransferase family 4 protein [Geodermatophilaceae bacterium]